MSTFFIVVCLAMAVFFLGVPVATAMGLRRYDGQSVFLAFCLSSVFFVSALLIGRFT